MYLSTASELQYINILRKVTWSLGIRSSSPSEFDAGNEEEFAQFAVKKEVEELSTFGAEEKIKAMMIHLPWIKMDIAFVSRMRLWTKPAKREKPRGKPGAHDLRCYKEKLAE